MGKKSSLSSPFAKRNLTFWLCLLGCLVSIRWSRQPCCFDRFMTTVINTSTSFHLRVSKIKSDRPKKKNNNIFTKANHLKPTADIIIYGMRKEWSWEWVAWPPYNGIKAKPPIQDWLRRSGWRGFWHSLSDWKTPYPHKKLDFAWAQLYRTVYPSWTIEIQSRNRGNRWKNYINNRPTVLTQFPINTIH